MRPLLRSQSLLPLLVALAVASAGSFVGAVTQAAFTDTGTANSTFISASVNIALSSASDCDDPAAVYSEAVGAVMTATSKGPGDVSTGSICIKNTGTVSTRWDLSGSITDDASGGLEGAMKIRFWSLNSTGSTDGTACASGFNADGSDAFLSVVQTNLGTAGLYSSAFMSTNPSIAASSSTQIAVSGYMKLCFSVALPNSVTDATLQSKTTTMDFTITGNQL